MFGDFRLLDPSGAIVSLPSRKVEGLLAILAVNHRMGIDRDEAAEILWPGKPVDAQRTSLRQALSQLRRALGDGSIETSRSHCRLGSGFIFTSDCTQTTGREGGFMPGHAGEWFETVRSEVDWDGAPTGEAPTSVVEGFAQTLRWLAESDPRLMVTLLRSSGSLIKGIGPSDLIPMLGLADRSMAGQGWVTYWRGASENSLRRSAKLLELALDEARRDSDKELASEVVLELGKVFARTGRVEDAKRMLHLGEDLASKSRSLAVAANAARLKGVFLSHWGDPFQGILAFERAEDLIDNPLDRATVQSSRAFFEAAAGLDAKAQETIRWPARLEQATGHGRIRLSCLMVETLLKTHDSGLHASSPDFEALSSESHALGFSQFGVYADELVAKAHLRSGNRKAASERIAAAHKARRVSEMARTPFEQRLLQTAQ